MSDLWFRLFRTKVTGRPVARMAAFTYRRMLDGATPMSRSSMTASSGPTRKAAPLLSR